MASKKPNISRSGERLIRLAYELEALAGRLRANDETYAADSVQHMARTAGNIGRALERDLKGGE